MIVARSVEEARAWVRAMRRTGARLALVPTMGALHRAHLALADFCRPEADAVAMSVFVNPTQFGPGEDYDRYPRDLERDARAAAEGGIDLLFAPRVSDMYPDGAACAVDVGPMGAVLEGAARPEHFRGVATVVVKLLHIFSPDVAVFGQKDAQQVVVVRRVARDLLLPVEVRCMPTVRDGDGLALSSRNAYLSPEERRAAPVLRRALRDALAALERGERSGPALQAVVREAVRTEPLARLEYAAVVEAGGLAPLARVEGRVLILVAARFGATRLLDNLCVSVAGSRVAVALP